MKRVLTVVLTLLATVLPTASAAGADLATSAERLRAQLAEAGLEIAFDRAAAARLVTEARQAYAEIGAQLRQADPGADRDVRAALDAAGVAAGTGDGPALAREGALAWTALLRGVTRGLEQSVQAGDAASARTWLAAREYRVASSLTRLNADATTAVEALAAGTLSPDAALSAVRSDVLDGYQARLSGALRDVAVSRQRGFRTLAAGQAALAQGYFRLLRPAYVRQLGEPAATTLDARLAALPGSLEAVQGALAGFRAAPLSAREVAVRAAQVTRFLSLVPVEYARGVKLSGGTPLVTQEVEVNEARTFLGGAQGALADLTPLLPADAAAPLTRALADLSAALSPDAMRATVTAPAALEADVKAALSGIRASFPAAWQKADASGDLDVVRAQLDAVVAAAQAGEWATAETARLDAYALLESGTEARIAVFNPELKAHLEGLIWNGAAPTGLAALIRTRAPMAEFRITRAALQTTLKDVARILGTEVAPAAVATNAGIIVFREGLEAVLILAALMGSLRRPAIRHLRRPMWLGAAGAFGATAVTWFIMQGALSLLGRYGEKLEAVVSVIAIGVLLLIMNWFFHQVYWTDRMASMQQHKHELTRIPVESRPSGIQADRREKAKRRIPGDGRTAGAFPDVRESDGMRLTQASGVQRAQWWGLAVLGFTSIYREGFETVLFLQSLVLQAGAAPVLGGAGLGLALVCGVGVAVFQWQAKLPMKKLLVWTGILIAAVLAVMVGNTVHTLQLVGWLPVHPLPVTLPAALGLWLGLHATWDGALLQVGSVVAVVGSFLAAEAIKERELDARRSGSGKATAS